MGLKKTLDQLGALYVDGGIEIVTPPPGAPKGRAALRTVIQPDGDVIFYVADPFSQTIEDLRRDHHGRVDRVIRSIGRLRTLAKGGQRLVSAAGAGFVVRSGLDHFLWGETRAALYGLALAATPMGIKWAFSRGFRWAVSRRLRRRL